MATEEPMLTERGSQDVTAHVRDYQRFTRMTKWGAITAVLIGLIVLWILK